LLLVLFITCKNVVNELIPKFLESRDIFDLESATGTKFVSFINKLFYLLQENLKKDENFRLLKEDTRNFILEIANDEFLEVLIFSLVNSRSSGNYNLGQIHSIIGDRLIDALINLGTQSSTRLTDLFKRYVFQTKIVKILTELGESALKRIKDIASQGSVNENVNPSLIELMGYLKHAELIDYIAPFVIFKDPLVRRAVILALGEIGTDKCREIILKISKSDKDKSIRILAAEQLKKIHSA